MITIVYSTRKKDEAYYKRIQDTCGVKDPQILCYQNDNEYSLTEIYNIGLAAAKFDVVLFIHDDLLFEAGSNWGEKMLNHFTTSKYAILGKAGTTFLTENCTWWADQGAMVGRVRHQMLHPQTGKILKWESEYSGSFGKHITPVTVVDGLLFGVHKYRILEIFDESLKGFHFYEIDFCIANFLKGVPIGVVFDFPLTHKSIGETNEQWEENRRQTADKYAGQLPIKVPIELFYKDVTFSIKREPKVTIIIPTKGKTDLVSNLIESLSTKSKYKNFDVIIADTGSEPEEKEIIKKLNETYPLNIRVVEYDYYNFGKINNDVVKNHVSKETELVIFCNNDIVLINDCVSLMVNTYLQNKHNCGTVGARLHFPDNSLQHAGIYLGKPKNQEVVVAGHIGYKTAYQYQLKTYSVVGNTAALLMIKKSLFEKIGGFNEGYSVCFEDVELNLKMLTLNYKNYLCGEAVAYHHESQTRDGSILPEDMQRMNYFISQYSNKLSSYIIKQ